MNSSGRISLGIHGLWIREDSSTLRAITRAEHENKPSEIFSDQLRDCISNLQSRTWIGQLIVVLEDRESLPSVASLASNAIVQESFSLLGYIDIVSG